MRKILINSKIILIICIAIISTLYILKFRSIEIQTSDQAYKFKQIKDLIHTQYSDFSCYYPGKDIDPNFKFFPSSYPIFRVVGNSCHFVFPYYLTIILLPFYLLGNITAINLIPLLAYFGILVFTYLFLKRFNDNFTSSVVLLSMVTGIGLLYYSFLFNDHIFVAFLLFVSFYYSVKGEDNTKYFIYSGIFAGASIYFRTETVIFGISQLLSLFLFRDNTTSNNRKKIIIYSISFGTAIVLFLFFNYILLGNLIGLRGIELAEKENPDFMKRLGLIWTFWFGRKEYGTLFFDTPVFLLLFVSVFLIAFRNIFSIGMKRIFFINLCYITIIPFFVFINPTRQFGERFLFAIYPICLIASIFPMLHFFTKQSYKFIIAVLVLSLSFYSLKKSYKMTKDEYNFLKYSYSLNKKVNHLVFDSDAVIIRNESLNTFFLNSENLEKKYFMAIDDKSFLQLITILKVHGLTKIAVIYPKPTKMQTSLPVFITSKTIVPEQFIFESVTETNVDNTIQINIYKI